MAAYNGQEAVVHLLVEAGADIRALGARHNTCLHFASSKGHQNLVNYFIQQVSSTLLVNFSLLKLVLSGPERKSEKC